MTPEEVELAQAEYDNLYNAHNVYARWRFVAGHFEALLDEARKLHIAETELARLRQVEEAARAMLDSEFLRKCSDRGATYSVLQHDAELVERLQQALDSK